MMRIKVEKLHAFVVEVMKKLGCDAEKADAVAEVLVEADMRGITSHGVARLKRYMDHIREGIIDPSAEPSIIFETPISIVVDGKNGVGQYVAKWVMRKVVEKAKLHGACFATVRNSNHYGIAGYYAEMAVKDKLMGVSMTNSAPLVVHTFAREPLLGTNPIALAFPTNEKYPILVDMATSVVPRGKLEVYSRLGKKIPVGWAVDETGHSTTDPEKVLIGIKNRKAGILPLGGEGETFGGHKGYGLALIVELLTSGLSLGHFSFDTYKEKGNITHFFAAVDLSLFGDPNEIMKHVNVLISSLKNAKKAVGCNRIYVHGEKEYEKRKKSLEYGIEIDEPAYKSLREIAKELGIQQKIK